MNDIGARDGLWDEADDFYYDRAAHCPTVPSPDEDALDRRTHSAVRGRGPRQRGDDRLPEFSKRLHWFLDHRPELARLVSRWMVERSDEERHLLSLLRGHRMKCLLRRMLDETEFLSDHGIRSISKFHEKNPFVFEHEGSQFSIGYVPGESTTGAFGGNSNWRGPVWMPVNFLLIE